MMKKLLLIILFLLSTTTVYAQHYDFDLISVHDLQINDSIKLGDSKTQVMDSLGTPDSTAMEYWEIRDVTVNELHYDHSSLTFLNNILESFYLRDSDFTLKYSGTVFKVSDSITELDTIFPTSFSNKTDHSITLYFGVEKNGEMRPTVDYLYIEYNDNGEITGISTRRR